MYWSDHYLVWISAAVALGIATLQHWNRDRLATAALAAITVTLGYGCVWNGNYLLAVIVNSRLHDAVFVGIDAKLLGKEYDQLFPLWTDKSVYKLLENSYTMLFPQVIAVGPRRIDDSPSPDCRGIHKSTVRSLRNWVGHLCCISGRRSADLHSNCIQERIL